jgi:hypothetical protein
MRDKGGLMLTTVILCPPLGLLLVAIACLLLVTIAGLVLLALAVYLRAAYDEGIKERER